MPLLSAFPNGVGLFLPGGSDIITTVAAVGHSTDRTQAVVRVLNRSVGAYAKIKGGPRLSGAFRASYSQERELDPNNSPYTMLTWYAADGNPLFRMQHWGNTGTYFSLDYSTAAGAWSGGAALNLGQGYGAIPRVSLTEIAVEWSIANAGGYVRLYWGGRLLGEIAGDTLLHNAASAALGIHGFALGGGTGFYQGTQYGYWSEVAIATATIRGRQLYSLPLTGAAGAENTMASGTPADVDELTLSTADAITASAAGQRWTAPVTLPAVVPGAIEALGIATVSAASDAGGPQSMKGAFRIGGATTTTAADPLSQEMGGDTHVIAGHPGGGPLRAAHLAGLEIGTEAAA